LATGRDSLKPVDSARDNLRDVECWQLSAHLLLGLPAHLRLDQIEITPQILILSLAIETAEAACPLCQQFSHRVHSYYTRTLQDLPCTGKALRLLVLVRRFFCENEGCARKIFAERLPDLTTVYAR